MLALSDGFDLRAFQLIAPYGRDSRKRESLPWVDKATGTPYETRTHGFTGGEGIARVKTYRDVLAEFAVHPEAKSAGPDGRPCGKRTVGLLRGLPVSSAYVVHVGKESNKLEAVEAGVEHDTDEIWTEYADPKRDPWITTALPMLKQMKAKDLAEMTGTSIQSLKAIRNGSQLPRRALRLSLMQFAKELKSSDTRPK